MTEKKETESGELVVIKEIDIPALFKKDGCDPIIEGLKKKAAEFEGDIETAKGRKAIASFARKFSTAKSYMDKLGKALSDEYREKIKPINAERNKIEACCDELRDKIRKPLTDWEDAEKKRVADIELRVNHFAEYLEIEFSDSEQVAKRLGEMKSIVIDDSFEEFELAATKAKEAALTQLEAKFIVLQSQEKERAEADRLEKERLEKEQKEREEQIAKDAAEEAKKEEKAKAKVKDEKAKQAIIDAKAATKKAEREKKEAEEKAEKEKKEAAEQAERDREEAIEAEKQRQADEIEANRKAEEKRQANKRHRGKINREAKASFVDANYSEAEAEKIIELIAKGKIANITVNY